MAVDRKLSANFSLHEFSGWEQATETQVARLEETVVRVLQPTRNRWGAVHPTSWLRWSDGTLRSGAHRAGGTVDFTTPNAPMREVASWGVEELMPSGYIGRWIYEPERAATASTPRQGEHIHVAPRADMIEVFGANDLGAYEEVAEGEYVPMAGPFGGAHSGAFGDPIPLAPIVATVDYPWTRWLLLGAAVGAVLRSTDRNPTWR